MLEDLNGHSGTRIMGAFLLNKLITTERSISLQIVNEDVFNLDLHLSEN